MCDKQAPEGEVRLKSETKEIPWYTDEIVALQHEKNAVLSCYRKTGNFYLKERYQSTVK